MKASKDILSHEKLISLLFISLIGTLSFLIYIFSKIKLFPSIPELYFPLLLIGVLTYEFAILSILSYYIAITKEKVAKSFKENKEKYYVATMSILGLTYVIINAIITKSLLVSIRDLILVILIIIATPIITKYFKKKKNGKTKNKIQENQKKHKQ